MKSSSIIIKHLLFLGANVEPALLDFKEGLNLVYGASNTGKSLTLKTIDFMLGGSKTLPDIKERQGYETILMGFEIKGDNEYTLERSLQGGAYQLHKGIVFSVDKKNIIKKLAPTLQGKSESVPGFFLNKLGLNNKKVAKNASGMTENLSFRDIVGLFLVDETSIQSERSPVESELGPVAQTRERSVFRMLLSGVDDSSIVSVVDEKTFKTSKAVKLEIIKSLLDGVSKKIEESYPDINDILPQFDRISSTLDKLQLDYGSTQLSLKNKMKDQQRVVTQVLNLKQRYTDIEVHMARFEKLDKIYLSDVERLTAIEEAGFLISLIEKKECPVCGAEEKNQKKSNHFHSVEEVRGATEAEIVKIESHRKDLRETIVNLTIEKDQLSSSLPQLETSLTEIEKEIQDIHKFLNKGHISIKEVLEKRDYVKQGIVGVVDIGYHYIEGQFLKQLPQEG